MLRAQTCLNLYICIHVKASCTDRAEELSQCAGLPFKTEIKQQLPHLIQSLGFRFYHDHMGSPSDPVTDNRLDMWTSLPSPCTILVRIQAIHSKNLLEALNAFFNYQYMECEELWGTSQRPACLYHSLPVVCPPGATRTFAFLIIQSEMNVMPTSHLRLVRIWVINRVIATFHPKRHLECYSPIWACGCWWPVPTINCPADVHAQAPSPPWALELLCSMTSKRQGHRKLSVLHSSWVRGSICDLLSLGLLTSKPKLSLKLETRWQPDAPSEPNLSG